MRVATASQLGARQSKKSSNPFSSGQIFSVIFRLILGFFIVGGKFGLVRRRKTFAIGEFGALTFFPFLAFLLVEGIPATSAPRPSRQSSRDCTRNLTWPEGKVHAAAHVIGRKISLLAFTDFQPSCK